MIGMRKGKNWTREEKQYLEDNWGTYSVKTLAKNLERSENSIVLMKNRLGLGRFLDNGEYVTYSQLLQAVYGISGACNAYRLPKIGFPIRKKRVGNNSFKVVYLNDFWKWAEENKRLLDFSKMEENILGKEPEWVKRKRSIDYECRVNTSPWTITEDMKLKRMIGQYKHTYTDIACSLNRTEGAVKRRLTDLGIKGRPIKAEIRSWKDAEVQILIFMFEEGYSFEKIGSELGRTALCCRGKIERTQNHKYFNRKERQKREKEVV
jgi:hypothetical protein